MFFPLLMLWAFFAMRFFLPMQRFVPGEVFPFACMSHTGPESGSDAEMNRFVREPFAQITTGSSTKLILQIQLKKKKKKKTSKSKNGVLSENISYLSESHLFQGCASIEISIFVFIPLGAF